MSRSHVVESPIFFPSPEAFREWLAAHHATREVLWVGFHKRGTGQPSLSWPESVDEALAYGWIDGVRKRIDEARYAIRFTPRQPGSTWSAINTRRMGELIAAGRVHPAGLAAFERREAAKSGTYSYERRREAELAPELERELRADAEAWRGFASRPPGYRRTAIHWVMSAKREATRRRRLATLIASSRAGRPIPPLDRAPSGDGE